MVFVTIYGLVNPAHNETSDKKEMEMILQRFLHVGRTEKRRLSLISVHLLLNWVGPIPKTLQDFLAEGN